MHFDSVDDTKKEKNNLLRVRLIYLGELNWVCLTCSNLWDQLKAWFLLVEF